MNSLRVRAISLGVDLPSQPPSHGLVVIQGEAGLMQAINSPNGTLTVPTQRIVACQALLQWFPSAPVRHLIYQPSTNHDGTLFDGVVPLRLTTWLNLLGKVLQCSQQSASSFQIRVTLQQVAAQYSNGLDPSDSLYPLYKSPDALHVAYRQWQHADHHNNVSNPDDTLDIAPWFVPLIPRLEQALHHHHQMVPSQYIQTLHQLLQDVDRAKHVSQALPPVAIESWEKLTPIEQHLVRTVSKTIPVIITHTLSFDANLLELPSAHVLLPVPKTSQTPVAQAVCSATHPSGLQGQLIVPTSPDALYRTVIQPWLERAIQSGHNRLGIVISLQSSLDRVSPPDTTDPLSQEIFSPLGIQQLQYKVHEQLDQWPLSVQVTDHSHPDLPTQWPTLGLLEQVLTLHQNHLDTKDQRQLFGELLDTDTEHNRNTALDLLMTHCNTIGQWPDGFSTWAWSVLRCFPHIQQYLMEHPDHLTTLQHGFDQLDALPREQLIDLLSDPSQLYSGWHGSPSVVHMGKPRFSAPDLHCHWHTPTTLSQCPLHQMDSTLWLDADAIVDALSQNDSDPSSPTRSLPQYLMTAQHKVHLLRWADPAHPDTPLHPSPLWQTLQSKYPQLFLPAQLTFPDTDTPQTEQQSHSPWKTWQKAPLSYQTVIDPDEVLSISASGLNNYMRCPRQYYYSQLLQIRGEPSDKAQAGTLMHRLLEALNTQFPQRPYTAHTLQALFQQYLDPLDPTFNEQDRALYVGRNATEQADLRRRITQTILDLDQSGYFHTYQPTHTLGEQAFRFTHPKLAHTRFQGSIDALLATAEAHNTQWHVLDYKHEGPTKWRGRDTTHLKHIATALKPLPDDAVSHAKRFADQDKRNYQIPLYYWATQYDEQLSDKLNQPSQASVNRVGLQVVRPPIDGPNGDHRGSQAITLLAHEIQQAETTITDTLQAHILNPIRKHTEFKTESGNHCTYCPHRYLCPDENALNAH